MKRGLVCKIWIFRENAPYLSKLKWVSINITKDGRSWHYGDRKVLVFEENYMLEVRFTAFWQIQSEENLRQDKCLEPFQKNDIQGFWNKNLNNFY